MKKLAIILVVLAIPSTAGAGTMLITGLPLYTDTSAGDVVLSFDIVTNGQFDNDSIYIWTTTGAILSDTTAINNINPGEHYDDLQNREWLGGYIDTTNITNPVIWADIAIPKAVPDVIIGDIISDLTLTISQGYLGIVEVGVLSENTGVAEDIVYVTIPEPTTIAILALGTLYLRRRK